MKTNKILLLIFLGMTLSSFSQKADPFSKGNYFIESNFRGGFMGGAEDQWILNFRPTTGKFIEDKWAVGIASKLELLSQKIRVGNYDNIMKARSFQSEIGLFTQYYLFGGLYAKLSATTGLIHAKYTGRPDWNKFSYTISPEIGYDVFLGKKKKVALGASFSYDISNIETGYGKVDYPIPFMHNFSNFRFNLSIKVIIGKKK